MEQRIGIERMEEAINLFGSFDENIRLLESEFQIPPRVLRNIMAVIEARSGEVIEKWTAFFGEIRYFC